MNLFGHIKKIFPILKEREDALEFLTAKRELNLIKRFLYTGKEQRREAKEKYEVIFHMCVVILVESSTWTYIQIQKRKNAKENC